MRLDLNSEPVSPTGSISSTGIINQLGRPNLDTLAVLIRETVQNSWDARLTNFGPLSYMVHGWTLTRSQRQTLSEVIFSEQPNPKSLSLMCLDSSTPLYGLIIADRGTTGLAGPTRADIVPEGSPRNFISFLRDVGQPSNQSLSGGTYGYGKASLYRASGMQTILVHTRCKLQNGRLESRFIASALGNRWSDSEGRQYTGRHWWGRDEGDIAEPILNEDADFLAMSLGMGGFNDDETGTTILIFDPLFHDRADGQQMGFEGIERTPLQALHLMAEYVLWFFWPKMLNSDTGKPAVHFHLQWEDTPVNIPHPAQFPPLAGFVEAMERLKGHRNDEPMLQSAVKDIAAERPRQHLGRLALQQFIVDKVTWFDTGDTVSLFEAVTHHTALMRQAELVVKYLEGKPLPNSKIGYAGVFITDETVDIIFASAEPPTHDDWNAKSLTDDWHKRYINVALRKISEEMAGLVQSPRTTAPIGTLTPLGAFATWLGESLIPTEIGASASRPRQRPNVELPNFLVRSDINIASNPSISPAALNNDGAGLNSNNISSTRDTNETEFPPSSRMPHQYEDNQQLSNSPSVFGLFSNASDSNITHNDPPPAPAVPVFTPPADSSKPPDRKPIIGRSIADITYDELVDYEGAAALLVTFNVKHAENADGTTVSLKAQAVLDSETIENEPPIGGSTAHVVRWISPSGQIFSDREGSIYVASDLPLDNWQVLVMLPDDMMVNVDVAAKAEIVP
jgi:hypothetical protein